MKLHVKKPTCEIVTKKEHANSMREDDRTAEIVAYVMYDKRILAGVVSTESAAQNQVAFGASMYAGSTLINLTLIWGFQIILKRDMLRRKGSLPEHSDHQQNQDLSSTKSCLSLIKHKLSFLDDMGVNIQKETTKVAKIMLRSLIPFATVELVTLVCSPIMILFALVVSGASLISYFAYQIGDPWIANRSLAYLQQEELEERFLFHIKSLVNEDIIKEDGNPNFKELKRCYIIFMYISYT
ncbi:putative EF-hand domain pair protein CML [Helianthus annuus]|nr:putative EF-hand domain pair protein CML [Helianthus annuus]